MTRHPKIARVFYPGLPDFPGHALAKTQMPSDRRSGAGAGMSAPVCLDDNAATLMRGIAGS